MRLFNNISVITIPTFHAKAWVGMLLSFLLSFIYLGCSDPEPVSPEDSKLFIRLYGGNGNETGRDLALMPDGGFVIVGSTTANSQGGSDVYIVRADATGNMLWENRFGGTGDDIGNSVITREDGSILVSGQRAQDQNPELSDVFVIALSAEGNLLGSNIYGDSLRNEIGTDIYDIPDAGFLISATWLNGDQSTYYMIEIDNNLNVLDKRERYLNPSDGVSNLSARSFSRTDPTPNEPLFVAFGSAQELLTGNTKVFKFQASYFNTNQDDTPPVLYGFDDSNSFCTDAQITFDGGYILCGTNVSGGIAYEMVVKVNKGRFLEEGWKKVYPNQSSRNVRNPAIFQTRDGGFILISSIELDDPLNDEISLLRLDAQGDEVWRKNLGGGSNDAGTGIVELEDGSFVLSGTVGFQINPGSQSKMSLMKVNAEGDLVPLN